MNYKINPTAPDLLQLIGQPKPAGQAFPTFPIQDISIEFHLQLLFWGEPEALRVELYEKGILCTFIDKADFASVAIPYFQVSVYLTGVLSFYFQDIYVRLEREMDSSRLTQAILVRKAEIQGEGYYGEIN